MPSICRSGRRRLPARQGSPLSSPIERIDHGGARRGGCLLRSAVERDEFGPGAEPISAAGFDMDISERFSVSLLGQAGFSENTTDIGGYARMKLRF
ncbi:MAG: hypothetical protein HPM95_15290 [Alphaproteobacteria bacterium]|nr:hypothetical protein [Alphaproteobacteria bacterium]